MRLPYKLTSILKIDLRISMSRGKKHRLLDIVLEYSAACSDGSKVQQAALYSMEVEGADD